MIIGGDRQQVIANIKTAANQRDFTAKVEVGDPVMSLNERKALVADFWEHQQHFTSRLNIHLGHLLFNALARHLSATTEIQGLDQLKGLPKGGAIITANHFNQMDALAIKRLSQSAHNKLDIVIEDTNLMLPGVLRYLMNNIGTIPLVNSPSYINNIFLGHLHRQLAVNHWVLIFPEQEMWWNYRKPRKPQRGAYYFAAKEAVPIISTFVELRSLPQLEKSDPQFYQTKYIVHVLPTIEPDMTLSVDKRSKKMMAQDYQQKVAAYEQAYNKKLDYDFTPWDIAGWIKGMD